MLKIDYSIYIHYHNIFTCSVTVVAKVDADVTLYQKTTKKNKTFFMVFITVFLSCLAKKVNIYNLYKAFKPSSIEILLDTEVPNNPILI